MSLVLGEVGHVRGLLKIIHLKFFTTNMVSQYNGNYAFTESSIVGNAPDSIGVYYCGKLLSNGNIEVYYIGKSCDNVEDRLLDHHSERKWSDVTHFGFKTCSTCTEAEDLEVREIKRLQPKYNTQGKRVYSRV